MDEVTWDDLADAIRFDATALGDVEIPDAPAVYAWWRDGEPVFVDGARRLQFRLTRRDTRVGDGPGRRSTFRSRIRLLLREQSEGDGSTDGLTERIDAWIDGCEVGWVQSPSYEQARQAALALLRNDRPRLHVWRPRFGEDEWLLKYVEQLGGRQTAGRIYVEVPIGGVEQYGRGAKTRFIDAVRLPGVTPGGIFYHHQEHFDQDLRGEDVEVIEVKKALSRTVIGQLIVADDLARAEWPEHGLIRLVALCTVGDPALEWICDERGIDLELVPRN